MIIMFVYVSNVINHSRLTELHDDNVRLNRIILEKDKENNALLDSIVLLKAKRDSIVYRIDTIIKYRNEKISNLDNVDADSILRIITNYLPD